MQFPEGLENTRFKFNFDLKTGHFSIMKIFWDLKKVFTNLEPEGQGGGIIMGVSRLLLIG